MPESSAMRRQPASRAAWRALSSAFSTKVVPVSGGGVDAELGLRDELEAASARATPRARAACPHCRWRAPRAVRTRVASAAQRSRAPRLQLEQLRDAVRGEIQQRIELVAAEGVTFGRALHLDEAAAVVHHDVHVGLGLRILGVVEIEHRHAADRCRRKPRRPGRAAGCRDERAARSARRRHRRARRRRR